MQRAVDAARAAVLNLPMRARQLRRTDDVLAALGSGSRALRVRWTGAAFVLALAALFGFLALSLTSWSNPEERPDAILGLLIVPFALHLAFGLLLRRKVARLSRRVRDELQARPSGGGTYACRVCGAPLPVSSLDRAIVACGYCRSHNTLDRSESTKATTAELVTFESFAEAALANARKSAPSTASIKALLWAPLASLVVLSVGLHFVDRALTRAFHPDPTVVAAAYDHWSGPGRACLVMTDRPMADVRWIVLRTLVGTPLYFGKQRFVVARVGKDGWGRAWLESDDGRWSRPNELCWPGPP